jgi:hypothetical protein
MRCQRRAAVTGVDREDLTDQPSRRPRVDLQGVHDAAVHLVEGRRHDRILRHSALHQSGSIGARPARNLHRNTAAGFDPDPVAP